MGGPKTAIFTQVVHFYPDAVGHITIGGNTVFVGTLLTASAVAPNGGVGCAPDAAQAGYTRSGVRRLRTLLLARPDNLLQPGHQMLHIKGPRLDEIYHATVN